jgi:UDP-N-acetylmuramyl pentapeptide phosphotransferase/UDP-N-acetylglucosamine-1-phosphate transferase
VTVLVGLVVGVLAVRLLVATALDLLRAPALERPNHRGRLIPTAAGALAVLAVVLVEGGRSLFGAFDVGHDTTSTARVAVLLACVGSGLLGLVDDVVGDASANGFRGHLGALARGEVSTGVVKIAGGALLAVVLVTIPPGDTSGLRVVGDAAIVALAANFVNLFDRAPGRALKVALIAWLPIALTARGDVVGVALAPAVGAFAGLLGDDLREHLMLGDTGAYAFGAVLGLGVVLEYGTSTRTVVLVVLAAVTLASEWVSFGGVIDRVGVLRKLDRLGRRA